MKNAKAWLFDLDGTLVDSAGLIMDSFRHAMVTVKGEVIDPHIFNQTIGRPLREQFSLYTDAADEVELLAETYSDYYRNHRFKSTLFDETRALLETLETRGIPMVVVTSKSHIGAENSTRAHDIKKYFARLIGSDDVTNGKPHPEPVQLALETLEVQASEAVFIGDSPHDMQAGAAANVYTIGVTWGPYSKEKLVEAGASCVVDSFTELKSLIP